ncbi:ATP-dependent DNA helicase MER3 [Sphaceloma murrayae]|uniref:DNA 3'-5' helicase n=1 Tax=Sphaceloma murrayae TaxID=2082308 RepID=A0A2K1R1L6_9PEZI|nr:ATP-dependent DNA helicase MER3 [Sphaceloma murrayae]
MSHHFHQAAGSLRPHHAPYELTSNPALDIRQGSSDLATEQEWEMDEFDRNLMRAPDYSSRQAQASMGLARMSLPTAQHNHPLEAHPQHSPHFSGACNPFDQDAHHSDRPLYMQTHHSSSTAPELNADAAVVTSRAKDGRQARSSRNLLEKAPIPNLTPAESLLQNIPTVRGVRLRAPRELPNRLKAIFPFPYFNAIQSKSFKSVYESDDNFVLSSPTGSGKTAIFELAICRLVNQSYNADFKVVYMAPTKALCSERSTDWKVKFTPLNLNVVEVTGDSEAMSLNEVQTADIIVTTPEKWDSLTRRWTDHHKLVQLIRLLLIDEVHILNKDRGAILEAVVSRTKLFGPHVRFVALSATVPNSQDLAVWLGRHQTSPNAPAIREEFGDEYRPVRLRKLVFGYDFNGNDYAFDTNLTPRLPGIIQAYSQEKPILIFCFTRQSCISTASYLAEWYASLPPTQKPWRHPTHRMVVSNRDLQATLVYGIGFHHAGVDNTDRLQVQNAYLSGKINVICCTSTLAIGINLPCHMAIIKGTSGFEDGGMVPRELSDMDVLQMIGRAGRPQFDTEATAVIMTRPHKVITYQRLANCQEVLESRLHVNLIEHFNAELGLGTITDVSSAVRWLQGTFLYVRLLANPDHYKLEDGLECSPTESLERFCDRAMELLEAHDLLNSNPILRQTDYGAAMARYYVSFETMKSIAAIGAKPKIAELLSILCNAYELRQVRLRPKEKAAFKQVNESPSIRFPVKVNLALGAHKATLIIQAVLGGIDILGLDPGYRFQFSIDQSLIFQHCRRLIRCIVDCQVSKCDSVGTRNALMLVRSLGARVWDGNPLQLQQLEGVGPISVRKLIGAGMRDVNDVLSCKAEKLEMIMGRHPPFGMKFLHAAKAFPRLRLSISQYTIPVIQSGRVPSIKLQADIAFLNDSLPIEWKGAPVYVTFLAETSDGRKVEFVRMNSRKIGQGLSRVFEASIHSYGQYIVCSVACEELAGTLVDQKYTPDIPPTAFHGLQSVPLPTQPRCIHTPSHGVSKLAGGGAKVRSRQHSNQTQATQSTDWDDHIGDADLAAVALNNSFHDIDELERGPQTGNSNRPPHKTILTAEKTEWQPEKLPGGRWKCNHHCKDKTKCNHKCCVAGLEKPPRPPKQRKTPSSKQRESVSGSASRPPSKKDESQAKLSFDSSPTRIEPFQRRKRSLEHVDLTQTVDKAGDQVAKKRVTRPDSVKQNTVFQVATSKPVGSPLQQRLLGVPVHSDKTGATIDSFDELSDLDDFDASQLRPIQHNGTSKKSPVVLPVCKSVTNKTRSSPSEKEPFADVDDDGDDVIVVKTSHDDTSYDQGNESDQDMLEAAMVGVEDSYLLRSSGKVPDSSVYAGTEDQPPSYQEMGATFAGIGPGTARRHAIHDGMNEVTPRTISPHFDAGNHIARDTDALQDLADRGSKEATEKERTKLKAFLLEEFGDSVELV